MGKNKTILLNSLMREFRYEDGSILKVNVINNKKEGPYERYGYGDIKRFYEEGSYKNGELDGVYKIYDKNGEIIEKGNYKNGKLEGVLKQYNGGRLYKEETYKNGELNGVYKYSEDGKIIEKVYTERDLEEFDDDDLLEGVVVEKEKLDVEYKIYDDFGEITEEVIYNSGKLEGVYRSYDKYGELEKEVTYKGVLKEGLYKIYEMSELVEEGTYKNGMKNRTILYKLNGRINKIIIYRNNRIIDEKEF